MPLFIYFSLFPLLPCSLWRAWFLITCISLFFLLIKGWRLGRQCRRGQWRPHSCWMEDSSPSFPFLPTIPPPFSPAPSQHVSTLPPALCLSILSSTSPLATALLTPLPSLILCSLLLSLPNSPCPSLPHSPRPHTPIFSSSTSRHIHYHLHSRASISHTPCLFVLHMVQLTYGRVKKVFYRFLILQSIEALVTTEKTDQSKYKSFGRYVLLLSKQKQASCFYGFISAVLLSLWLRCD